MRLGPISLYVVGHLSADKTERHDRQQCLHISFPLFEVIPIADNASI